ncbi:MAG: OmpA family protein, partial [Gammaproteobacteria bacterium]|nr:OmpA family protein [Gammaproteobacteria bacterium]
PPVRAMVNVAEVDRMKPDLVKVDADAIGSEIAEHGHIALYGIYFNTDEAELQDASEVMLQEMVGFLAANPKITVYIVGHTDNVGNLDYNMALSQRRAEAVVHALVSRYDIDAERVISKGVGPLTPVATNRTEFGRALNRRVEIVEK